MALHIFLVCHGEISEQSCVFTVLSRGLVLSKCLWQLGQMLNLKMLVCHVLECAALSSIHAEDF